MLDLLRNRLSKSIVFVIIGMLILSFAIWGLSGPGSGKSTDSDLIYYNKTPISVGLLQKKFLDAFSQLSPAERLQLKGSPRLQKVVERQLLNAMVTEYQLGQFMQANNYHVGTTLLQQQIASDPRFVIDEQFSPQRFKSYLKQHRISQSFFADDQKRIMVEGMLRHYLSASKPTLRQRQKHLLSFLGQQRVYDQYTIEPHKPTVLSENEIKAYYVQHSESFRLPPSVSIRYVLLSADDMVRRANPTPEALKVFYHTNEQWYQLPASVHMKKLLLVRKSHHAPMDAMLAKHLKTSTMKDEAKSALLKDYQVDRVVANKQYAKRGLATNLRQVVDQAPLGQWVRYQTSSGSVKLLLVSKRQPESIAPYHTILKRVRSDYIHHIVQQQYFDLVNQLKDKAYNAPNALTPLANFLNTKVQSITVVQNETTSPSWLSDPTIQSFLFSPKTRKKTNSPVFELKGNRVVVLQVIEKHPKRLQALSQVSDQIRHRLVTEKWGAAAKKIAMDVKHALMNASALSIRHGLKFSENKTMSGLPQFSDSSADHQKKTLVFGLDFKHDHGIGMMQVDAHRFLVVKLKAIHLMQPQKDKNVQPAGARWLDDFTMKYTMLHDAT